MVDYISCIEVVFASNISDKSVLFIFIVFMKNRNNIYNNCNRNITAFYHTFYNEVRKKCIIESSSPPTDYPLQSVVELPQEPY